MEVKEVSINVDQNVQVYDDNRFLTLRVGVGLKADVQGDLAQAARALRAQAEKLLADAMVDARVQAQARMKVVLENIREEKDLM